MKVSIIGTGYVGLVSGVCLAEVGHEVVSVDVDRAKVDSINAGVAPIYEAGLEELLKKNLGKRFRCTTDLAGAVLSTDISIIAVGTPSVGGEIDLRFIKEAAVQIGEAIGRKPSYHVVVVKSTVVPGTTDGVVLPLLEKASGKRAGEGFGVGMNPEFLREGEAVHDFLYPDRIVLGVLDSRTGEVLEELYRSFSVDKVRTNPRTAEMIKYTGNALLASLISFSNEIGNLCRVVGGVDVVEVMQAVHLDKRISPILPDGQRVQPSITSYLQAGCGFGGSCFPKDLKALIAFGQRVQSPMRLLEAVVEINQAQPRQVLELLRTHFPNLEGVRVAVLGLAFKPGTDDLRESPAIPILRELLEQKAVVSAYDPIVRTAAGLFPGAEQIVMAGSLPAAVANTQAIVVLTRWPEFKSVPGLLKGLTDPPLLVDGRRMFDRSSVVRYEGIGLKAAA